MRRCFHQHNATTNLRGLHIMTTATKTPAQIETRSDEYIDAWNYQINQMIKIKFNLTLENGKEVDAMVERFQGLIRTAASNLETPLFSDNYNSLEG